MKHKTLIFAFVITLFASFLLAGMAMASSLNEADSPDCHNTITTIKVTEPGGGEGFDFTLKWGSTTKSYSLDDQGSKKYYTNSWSVFTITESAKEGYQLKDITCTANSTNGKTANITYDLPNRRVTIDLDTYNFDGNVTCTFTNVTEMDYGDLPANYGLTSWSAGARHYNPGDSIRLGAIIDQEWDGQPNSSATGDDTNGGPNDEDGVERGPVSWGNGSGQVIVTVTDPSNSGGCLMGWLDYYDVSNSDFGADGIFTDSFLVGSQPYSEKIIDNRYVSAGSNTINFPLPPGLKNVGLYARFRLSPYDSSKGVTEGRCNQTAVGLSGLVIGGEVEDYAWVFGPTAIQLKSFQVKPVQTSGVASGVIAILVVLSLVFLWTIQRKPQQ